MRRSFLHRARSPSEDIDAAVLHTLETNTLPVARERRRTRSFDRPLFACVGWAPDKEGGEDTEKSVGSGVVIVDKGIILTNLHVVLAPSGYRWCSPTGSNPTPRSSACGRNMIWRCFRRQTIPDDLFAATMRSTADLAPGDQVIAVGFPFGIGPSVTAGVVSGLRREFHSPEGKRVLTNLIQFDAAVNPGSSGGPLVTTIGEVVGIVTAILNPTDQRFFVGIGFAVPIENAAAAVGVPPF